MTSRAPKQILSCLKLIIVHRYVRLQADHISRFNGQARTTQPHETAIVMMDLVIDNMDINNKDEMLKRVRQVTGNGATPPKKNPTPKNKAHKTRGAWGRSSNINNKAAEANLVNSMHGMKAQVERLTAREKAVQCVCAISSRQRLSPQQTIY